MLILAACWRDGAEPPAPAKPVAPRIPHARLAIEPAMPGRLVYDRGGRAWEVKCDGHALTRRPWEGGDFEPAGPCEVADHAVIEPLWTDDQPAIAIDGDVVAIDMPRAKKVVVSERGRSRRELDVGRRSYVVGLALDGDAVLLVVRTAPGDRVAGVDLPHSLAAIVRAEPGRAIAHELVAYMSTGASVNPKFVAPGRDRLVLVDGIGLVATCTYQLACSPPVSSGIRDVAGAQPLPDGGLAVYEHEYKLARITADGKLAWNVRAWPLAIIGATAREVWIISRPQDPRDTGLAIEAFDLATGKLARTPAMMRTRHRDPLGRYLAIAGVSPTLAGDVVRGVFGGRLTAGHDALSTDELGYVCWYETPHSGDEYAIGATGTCDARHEKARLTKRQPFVAHDATALAQ
jgi:hypothetical protein